MSDTTVRELREAVRGQAFAPGDEGYADACRVWNGMHDERQPALIVRCSDKSDVVAAIRFARDEGLSIAVRGGGHNVAGNATCDGGLVIDLSGMKRIEVDAEQRLARVEGGALWAEVDAATQPFGLATTGGLVSSTGVAGFTLGGGIGWLMRKHGLACDNLIAAEVVTADGQTVVADEDQNSELLWGLRGGGGNFGVVTEFTFRLHPLGPMVLGGMVAHPLERAGEVLRFWREWAAGASDDVCTLAAIVYAPPEPFVPEEVQGTPIIAIAAFHTDADGRGADALRELREYGPPAIDVIGPMPYTALQQMFDGGAPSGSRNYWRSAYLADLNDGAIDAILANAAGLPVPLGQIHIHQMGGAAGRVPAGATAFAHRDAAFVLNLIGMWLEPGGDEQNIAWVREISADVEPHTTGAPYVNFLGDEGADRVRAAYGDDAYTRLQALKRQFDPANTFRLNQNVVPA
jgi:FAD/FMN-containing dehydrogenase